MKTETEIQNIRFAYDKLREEILHNDTLSLQLLNVTLILVTGAMAFAFQEKSSDLLRVFIFFCVIGIVCISGMQTMNRVRGTFLIASYMRKVLEPDLEGVSWETHLAKFRTGISVRRFEPIQNTLFMSYSAIAIANLFIMIYYVYELELAIWNTSNLHVRKIASEKFFLAFVLLSASVYVVQKIVIYFMKRWDTVVINGDKSFDGRWNRAVITSKYYN